MAASKHSLKVRAQRCRLVLLQEEQNCTPPVLDPIGSCYSGDESRLEASSCAEPNEAFLAILASVSTLSGLVSQLKMHGSISNSFSLWYHGTMVL